jgi:2,3-bisphosphoglycerate-dependent phosphoglycerate mutase
VPRLSYPQGPFVPPPDATELILVRHGASADAVPGEPFELIEGQSNPPLSPTGETQARAVAGRLAGEPVVGLFISTLDRTAQTAAPLAALTGLEPVVLPDLREVHVGELEGGRFRVALAERDPVFTRLLAEQRWEVIPGAESSAALAARVRAAAEQVAATVGPGAAAVVITHGGVIAELCRQATGSEPFAFLRVDNASITRIVVDAGGSWLLRSYNDTTHLEGAAAGPPSRLPP